MQELPRAGTPTTLGLVFLSSVNKLYSCFAFSSGPSSTTLERETTLGTFDGGAVTPEPPTDAARFRVTLHISCNISGVVALILCAMGHCPVPF